MESAPRGAEPEGPALAVEVAALHLTGVGDVVWDVQVENGREPTGDVVWQRRISSTGYGDSAGSASYVGTCDADPLLSENVVKVWVVGVYAEPVATLGAFAYGAADEVSGVALAFQNPTDGGPLTRSVVCRANEDAAVRFDVALMRPAQQGFFDIAVNFNDIFCSAKFDCCVEDEGGGCTDVALLFDTSGDRSTTMVLGFACTAGAGSGVETNLYLDALTLDCTSPSAETFTLDFAIDPSGAQGNQCEAGKVGGGDCDAVVAPTGLDADAYLYQVGLYRGQEQLQSGGGAANKVYWNVALGARRKVDEGVGIEDCWLKTRGTADDVYGTSVVDHGDIAAGAVYPYVQWEVDLASCRAEALAFGVDGAMVRTEYTKTTGVGTTFAFGYGLHLAAGSFCPAPCENDGICVSGSCSCPAGFEGVRCQTDVDDCVEEPCGAGACTDLVNGYACACDAGYYDDGATCAACATGCAVCSGPATDACSGCAAGYTLNGTSCEAVICGVFEEPCPAGFTCNTALAVGTSYPGFCVSDGSDALMGAPSASVWVPAGDFVMGCNVNVDSNCVYAEYPAHLVTFAAGYVIDRTEVTAAAYYAWCGEGFAIDIDGWSGSCLPGERETDGPGPTYPPAPPGVGTRLDHPINDVNVYQARAYCQSRGADWDLCDEERWERAARGGCETVTGACNLGMRKYPWGNTDPTCTEASFLNGTQCETVVYTTPVDARAAGTSPYGAMNMAGNVWEWVTDWYVGYDTPPSFDYTGTSHTIRGGAWDTPFDFLRGSYRHNVAAASFWAQFGLRCCRSYP